jgi:hypothetical protein
MAVATGESSKVSRSSSTPTARSTKQRSIGSSVTASVVDTSRSSAGSDLPAYPFFVVCISGYEPSLYVGRTYKVIKPERKDGADSFRVVDEEREDYLYPRSWFIPVPLDTASKRKLSHALGRGKTGRERLAKR